MSKGFGSQGAIAIYEKGLELVNQGKYEEAIKAFDQAISLRPDVSITWVSRGVALERLGRYQEALVSHEQAIAINPNDFLAWYNKGIQLQELHRYSEAIAAHQKALQLKPKDIDTLYNLGLELEKIQHWSEALHAYEQILHQDGADAYTWNRKGVVLDALHKYPEAIAAHQQATRLMPSLAQFWHDFGLSLSHQGSFQEAIAAFDTVIGLDPTHQQALAERQLIQSKLNPPPTQPATPIMPPAQYTQPSVQLAPLPQDRPLSIAGRIFQSRLMTGTGKYRSTEETQQSIQASGCEIVTVAVRRIQANTDWQQGLTHVLDWTKLWMLPNTAGCQTAEEAVRVARLGREMARIVGQEDNNFVKLEVIPDSKYLLPDPVGTLEAAEILVKEGFAVLPYINADPILAERLQAIGCATVMPLGSPIGSGRGIRNADNIAIIIENAIVPVVIDAGIGSPSEAAQAMELGADAVLINTAIAQAQNPMLMAQAMAMGVIAGRAAYLAGRIPVRGQAQASSPVTGVVR